MCRQVGCTFLKNSDREPFLSGLLAGLGAGLAAVDWTAMVPVRACADSGCKADPACPVMLTCTGMKVIPPLSLAMPAERSEVSVPLLIFIFIYVFRPSPCTGMVTVCPLLAVTVAVAMVTTVCPAGMAVTMLAGLVTVVAAAPVEVVEPLEVRPCSLSTESTNRRRRAVPARGEL